ncbi:universal stress protein [Streptomyces sp. NPDC015661]|uniref:universal stress protein n=1 Tax=Streptomyces sp. NPDC015661 TaxID=3364961 RepID=UPI0036FE53AC
MESPVVVGVDGSHASLAGSDRAVDEAVRHGRPLRVVHASPWERYEGVMPARTTERPSGQVLAENIVGTASERARRRAPDLTVTADVLAEDTATALLRKGQGSVLLAVGSREQGEQADPVDSGAVRFAYREAAVRDAELDVVRAWRRPAHEPVERPLPAGEPGAYFEHHASELLDKVLETTVGEHLEVRLLRSTVEGSAQRVLTERSAPGDRLVVGARRRERLLGLELGKVAHRALHHASRPVAVIPQHHSARSQGGLS